MEKLTLLNFSIVLLLFLGTTIGRCQAVVRHIICWQPHVAQIVSENLLNSEDLKNIHDWRSNFYTKKHNSIK